MPRSAAERCHDVAQSLYTASKQRKSTSEKAGDQAMARWIWSQLCDGLEGYGASCVALLSNQETVLGLDNDANVNELRRKTKEVWARKAIGDQFTTADAELLGRPEAGAEVITKVGPGSKFWVYGVRSDGWALVTRPGRSNTEEYGWMTASRLASKEAADRARGFTQKLEMLRTRVARAGAREDLLADLAEQLRGLQPPGDVERRAAKELLDEAEAKIVEARARAERERQEQLDLRAREEAAAADARAKTISDAEAHLLLKVDRLGRCAECGEDIDVVLARDLGALRSIGEADLAKRVDARITQIEALRPPPVPPKKGTTVAELEATAKIIDCAAGLPSAGVTCEVDDGRALFEVRFVSERVQTARTIGPSWDRLPNIIDRSGPAEAESGVLKTPALFSRAEKPGRCERPWMNGLNPAGWCNYMTYLTFKGHVHMRTEILAIDRRSCSNAMQELLGEPESWSGTTPKGSPQASVRKRHAGFEYTFSIAFTSQGCMVYERTPLYEALEHEVERGREAWFRRAFSGNR